MFINGKNINGMGVFYVFQIVEMVPNCSKHYIYTKYGKPAKTIILSKK